MKFVSIVDELLNDDELKTEWKNGLRFKSICLGERHLFFRKNLKICCLSYSLIDRFFKRIMLIPTRMKTADGNLHIENIVFCVGGKETLVLRFPGVKATAEAMSFLMDKLPGVPCECHKEDLPVE